jgi:hypothetical protein
MLFGIVGCGDGVERGSVQVPSRSEVGAGGAPGGGDAKPGQKSSAAEPKVMMPGGKKM